MFFFFSGESDTAFTPSPPVTMLNLEARMRNIYADQNAISGSSSNSSVVDWDNGQATVLRREVLPPAVLERLSVRTEIGQSRQHSLTIAQTTTSSKDDKQQKDNQSVKNHPYNLRSLATSLTSLTRELTPTISDVYHERNLGLGLAPSLSKLLEEVGTGSENEQSTITRVDHHSQTQNWLQNEPELCRRDEADGRSIAESQCSATSSNKIRGKAPAPTV